MAYRSRPAQLLRHLSSPLVTHALPAASGNSVLLTFDDGPTLGVSEQVLRRLADAEARAVFFVLGRRIGAAEELLREVRAAGHAVGNHSYEHDTGRFPDPAAYLADMRRCRDRISEILGQPPLYFRAPAGRLHPASLLGPPLLKMRHVLWSLDSNDWLCRDAAEAREAARRVLAEVRGGDIVLLHEYAAWTVDLLDELLPGLQERNFDLASGLDWLEAAPQRGGRS